MKSYICLFALSCFGLMSSAQTPYTEVNKEIEAGNFQKAQAMIAGRMAFGGLPDTAACNLRLQSALLSRIAMDFNRDEAYVRKTLAPYYPNLSADQLQAWEQSGDLEMRIIEGEKRYFRNAVWNLFRVNAEAKAQREKVDGPRTDELGRFLQGYLPQAVQGIEQSKSTVARPRQIRITYTLRVKPGAVPDGEMVRAWLPYPRASSGRLGPVQLISSSEPFYIISPLAYPHTSIYMEKAARANEWVEFSFQAQYTAYDEWHNLREAALQPYDTISALYRYYTREREQHIRFTPQLKALSEEIVGSETDPVKKAWLIFEWIGENIPWASALEYSTMPDIPSYCIRNRRGDCGMKSLLFITLCRYNGIPAKWQSGWFLYPDNLNLHDWAELYFEGLGWVPVDPDFNLQDISGNESARAFFFGGADAYRLIVNDDFSGSFFPAKIYPRSETVDFQRGEVEWRGGNLYFDQWEYDMEVAYGQE
ncbi:MAG: transglutaminase domain-containing protein [Phaeodactylibacter sp.]|nr:transglutaminase domain-containing protein [Phaeodactylibacter sp.]MCB9276246.1 transglutaminase domain-containing protein [Lewinellaceae bacterium]